MCMHKCKCDQSFMHGFMYSGYPTKKTCLCHRSSKYLAIVGPPCPNSVVYTRKFRHGGPKKSIKNIILQILDQHEFMKAQLDY